jgi:hypothetical protein
LRDAIVLTSVIDVRSPLFAAAVTRDPQILLIFAD